MTLLFAYYLFYVLMSIVFGFMMWKAFMIGIDFIAVLIKKTTK